MRPCTIHTWVDVHTDLSQIEISDLRWFSLAELDRWPPEIEVPL